MRVRLPPKPKTVHMGDKIRKDGAVSALCYAKPRRINLRRATWTLVESLVTCERCRAAVAILAEQAASDAEETYREAFGG